MESTRPGDLLAGRYRLTDLLSEARDGRFWKAHDTVLDRPVAIHVLADDDARAPLLLEAARASATVNDPHLLRVLDADQRDGSVYIVNEWGAGISLDNLLGSGGPIAPRRAAWVAAEVADTIAAAHAAGSAHGRLNPENILLGIDGGVHVIGFAVEAALLGLSGDRRGVDLVDLAGLLYAMLTGRWAGESTSAVPAAPVDRGHVLRPRQVRAGVPRVLDDLCDSVLGGAVLPAAAFAARMREYVGESSDLSTGVLLGTATAGYAGSDTGPERPLVAVPPLGPILGRLATPDAVEAAVATSGSSSASPAQSPAGGGTDGSDDAAAPEDEPERTAGDAPGETTDDPTGVLSQGSEAVAAAEAASDSETSDSETAAGPAPDEDAPKEPVAKTGGDKPARGSNEDTGEATVAGLPTFDDTGGDGAPWFAPRPSPPAPPPALEEPPARPLFADEPRQPRYAEPQEAEADDHGSWMFSTPVVNIATEPRQPVPGRRWFRLALGVALAILLVIAVVIGVHALQNNATPGPAPATGSDGNTPAPSPSVAPSPITGLRARDFDPEGDPPEEYSELVHYAIDGNPATVWHTSSYNDQIGKGPRALKSGVGLVIDLGKSYDVSSVAVTVSPGAPTTMSLFVSDTDPAGTPQGQPAAEDTGAGKVTLHPTHATGRYLTIWLTALPRGTDGLYRGVVAEVGVTGVAAG